MGASNHSNEETESIDPTEPLIYDTVLMRDTCGNARTKVKNYFYYNVYDKSNFKYNSAYDELILLDVLEGTKKHSEYLKRFIPFLIIICLGAVSWLLWLFMCYCIKKPQGCLKRYSRTNKQTRRICFFIYFGFSTAIIILILISLIYLNYSRNDLNGTVCTLSMLRYEMMYGQSLLSKDSFKKPFWYGITTLSEDIEKVKDLLLNKLRPNCQKILENENLIKNVQKNKFDELGETLKEDLELIYKDYKDKYIEISLDSSTPIKIIPLYISNIGYKENNETYTGKILYDYQIHYEYLIETITDPILEICGDLEYLNNENNEEEQDEGDGGRLRRVQGNEDGDDGDGDDGDDGDDDEKNGEEEIEKNELIKALKDFKNVISTLEDSMNIVTNYITSYLSKHLVNLKNIYFIFCFIFLTLIGAAILVLSIIFALYYFKPISAFYSSIISMLYVLNFLMIFCLFFSGITGIFSIYFSNASDIVDCAYSSKNIGSDNPRIINRTTASSVLTRCIRGDGNLLDEFLDDNARKLILDLKKINSIYIPIQDAYKRMTNEEDNMYNTFDSAAKVIQDFELMKDDFSLTTSREESGEGDINYMLNELNRYTLAGMKYQPICDTSTYDLWTLRKDTAPFAQIEDNEKEINYKSIIASSSDPSNDYGSACPLNTEENPKFSTSKEGVSKYYTALKNYYEKNLDILEGLLTPLKEIKENFETKFIPKMKSCIIAIKTDIADPFWEVFGPLVNDSTNYTGIEDAEKVDILGWVNCSILGKNYNVTMNTIKTTFVVDLQIVTYCSLIAEGLIIVLYFIIVSLANNIRDKDLEKTENKYDVESRKEDGEIFEIIENNKYKEQYDYEGELITISKSKKNKKLNSNYIPTSENFNYKNDRTNDITKDDELISARKNLPENIMNVPKFDIAENIEAIKNVDVKKLIDKHGKAVMHPIRISINSPLGVMEASDKYAHKYTYDIFEPLHEDESENNNSGIENGSFYQNNKGKKNKKGKKKNGKDKDKESKSSDFSF